MIFLRSSKNQFMSFMRRVICWFAFFPLLYSCSTGKIDSQAVSELEARLVASNQIIEMENENIFHLLEDRKHDPSTREKILYWESGINKLRELSADLHLYLEHLKEELRKEAGMNDHDKTNITNQSDKKSVRYLFIEKGKGQQVYEKLKEFEKTIKLLKDNVSIKEYASLTILDKESFLSSQFHEKSAIAVIGILTGFQSQLRIFENRYLNYCVDMTASNSFTFNMYSLLIGQNSSIMRKGDTVEINTGIGAFTTEVQPEIFINGKLVRVGVNGIAIYKQKVLDEGEHRIPVTVRYIDQHGEKKTITKEVVFTVK